MENRIFNLINQIDITTISDSRISLLLPLCDYIQTKVKQKTEANLIFICTHNSRRSQLSQMWAKVIADFYGIDIKTFSGGTEITACNERTIESFKRMGFIIHNPGGQNPHYELIYHPHKPSLLFFSKNYDDAPNPKENFAAILTCTDADENCPFIEGAEKRISLPYEDPKAFDDTTYEAKVYDERSIQIATEMKYVFSRLLG